MHHVTASHLSPRDNPSVRGRAVRNNAGPCKNVHVKLNMFCCEINNKKNSANLLINKYIDKYVFFFANRSLRQGPELQTYKILSICASNRHFYHLGIPPMGQ